MAASASRRTAASARGAATRQAAANRRLRALVQRLHGCVSDLPATSARVLTLRAGSAGRPGLSPAATARVLKVSVGREAQLEGTALSSLRAAGRAGCNVAGTPTILTVAATESLVASPPALEANSSGASTPGADRNPAAGGVRSRRVTRGSVDHRGKSGMSQMGMVQRASTDATPTWAVLLALFGLALAGTAAVVRQAVVRRHVDIASTAVAAAPGAAIGSASGPAPRPASPPVQFASLKLPPGEAGSTASPVVSKSNPGSVGQPEFKPARSTVPKARAGIREHVGVAVVMVTALAGGILRLLSRHRTGRH